jgi:hypothetical protein
MKVIFEKKNSWFANMKSYLDTHFFLNFGSFYAQVWPASNEDYLEELELWV